MHGYEKLPKTLSPRCSRYWRGSRRECQAGINSDSSLVILAAVTSISITRSSLQFIPPLKPFPQHPQLYSCLPLNNHRLVFIRWPSSVSTKNSQTLAGKPTNLGGACIGDLFSKEPRHQDQHWAYFTND